MFIRKVCRAVCVNQMIVYGDSNGKGVIWSETLGRYRITRESCVRLLTECLPFPVENRSVMGSTAQRCLEGLEQDDIPAGALVVFAFGSNDSDMDWDAVSRAPDQPHAARVPVEAFEAALRQMIRITRSRGAEPVIATPVPLVAERYFNWVSRALDQEAILRYLGDTAQMARWQERWAHAAERVAYTENAPLADLRDAMLRCLNFEQMYCADGIHLNEKGHRYLFETLRESLPLLGGSFPKAV